MERKLLALDSSALPQQVDTMVVACDAPACLIAAIKSERQPGPDF